LCKQGVLHRDISAGNVLLSAVPDAEPGHEGFITDLEFARITTPALTTANIVKTQVPPVLHPSGKYTELTTRSHTRFETVPVPRGAAMSVSG